MKTRITYPIALVLGFVASLLLKNWAPYHLILATLSPIVKSLGIFILFPLIFVLALSAIASLRRHKDTLLVFAATIMWALLAALLLSFAGMGIFLIKPFSLTLTSMGSSAAAPVFFDFSNIGRYFISDNAFHQFTLSSITLLPILVVALFIGYALRPDKEAIRPAYVVVNSFGEVMVRLARIMTVWGALFLLVISAEWFLNYTIADFLQINDFWLLIGLAIAVVATLVILLPLLFGILTGFKGGNPYRIISGAFPAVFASGFSNSILFGTIPLIALTQQNIGSRKRALGISVPLLTVISRAGSALIATLVTIGFVTTLQGALPPIQLMVLIALGSALFSLGASFSPGAELIFIIFMLFRAISAPAYSIVEGQLLILLPLLQILGLSLDAFVIAFGAAFSSRLTARASDIGVIPAEKM
ncbi:MAG: dicarboxylate/amino acid:cation symporter [Spirochaetales bacterium]|jgi:Na+/H+-dicarboxylate symporter|nr:dicarboxylate/amino acid:cation symporter [Spirochaetales bacterium]